MMTPMPGNLDRRRGARSRGVTAAQFLAVLVPACAAAFALAPNDDRADIAPDPAIQSAIARVASADRDGQRPSAIDQALQLADRSPAEFVRQAVYFASRARHTHESMAVGVLMRRLDVPDDTVARALVPCLESSDAALAKSVRDVLGGIEKRTPGRRPDFSVYRGIIADRLRAGESVPVELARYLYDADAGMALLTFMRAHELRKPEQVKPILWAEHVVSDGLWKQDYGFLAPDKVEPAAIEQLSALARHDAWWARLYAAEIMRKHAAFRQADTLAALRRDANALVRDSAARVSGTP